MLKYSDSAVLHKVDSNLQIMERFHGYLCGELSPAHVQRLNVGVPLLQM